jgi:hypothetical protein
MEWLPFEDDIAPKTGECFVGAYKSPFNNKRWAYTSVYYCTGLKRFIYDGWASKDPPKIEWWYPEPKN